MSAIGDAVSSAMTPAGYNNYMGQQNQQAKVGSMFANALGNSGLGGAATSAANFASTLEPQRQTDIQKMLDVLNPNNTASSLARMNTGVQNAEQQQINNTNLNLRSQGVGEGGQAGATANIGQQAQTQMAGNASTLNSPQYQANSISQMLQAISGGQSDSGLMSMLQGLLSGVYGQPQAQVQSNPLSSVLGSIAGNAANSWVDKSIGV